MAYEDIIYNDHYKSLLMRGMRLPPLMWSKIWPWHMWKMISEWLLRRIAPTGYFLPQTHSWKFFLAMYTCTGCRLQDSYRFMVFMTQNTQRKNCSTCLAFCTLTSLQRARLSQLPVYLWTQAWLQHVALCCNRGYGYSAIKNHFPRGDPCNFVK